jgi:hypothetical protein
MKKTAKGSVRFVVCVKSKGYEASLELCKLYRLVPDAEAERRGYLRVVDESGEDYGYSADRFLSIEVPKPIERALLKAAS